VFSHGWPLSADDWDAQLLFFLHHGYRVIAHDRRGHGRSTQTADGHDMDHYADDLAALTAHLDLKGAIHVGHSTGGGEVARYLGRHGESRVAKAALISAVPPLMVKTAANPQGLPKECLMACRRNSPPIVRNSIATWRPGRFTATTGLVLKPRRPSSRIGGARA
jgi:non-heme chloroperoxidase